LGFLAWFFFIFIKVPPLKIDTQLSLKKKMSAIDNYLYDLNTQRKFNGAVLILRNEQVLLMNTYGYTDYSKKVKLNSQSSFRLASLSKQFTAAGMMLLKTQGKVDFDDKVHKHLNGFPYQSITIRQLLNHTSGLPDIYFDLAKQHKDEVGEILTISKVVELINTYKVKTITSPNEKFNYSNTNYVLLAAIVEKVSNQSFESFMKSELFTPLGMKNSRIWNLCSVDKLFENKTDSFEDAFGKCEPLKPSFIDGVAGDGAVFSSIEDFVIWNKFWDRNELIPNDIMQEALLNPVLNDGSHSNYGFGWLLDKDEILHNGSWLGARTFILRNKQEGINIVILDNSSNLHFDHLVMTLNKTILKILKDPIKEQGLSFS
jgi:CubicO group peptidase (beta-lactamase class C family)